MRADAIDRAAVTEIGSALASQPRDNPLRQEAYRRAEAQLGNRYRCEWR